MAAELALIRSSQEASCDRNSPAGDQRTEGDSLLGPVRSIPVASISGRCHTRLLFAPLASLGWGVTQRDAANTGPQNCRPVVDSDPATSWLSPRVSKFDRQLK